MDELPDLRGMSSGAMPDDWHERHDTGYVPGGADKMAERILSEPTMGSDGAGGDGWDIRRDTVSLKDGQTKSTPGNPYQGRE